MTKPQHKITAISLALLVLISTTGISMNMMLCTCTGKQYLSMLSFYLDLDCCQDKLPKAKIEKTKKQDCCSHKQTKACKAPKDSNQPTIMAKKDCCTSNFKYAKANINLNFVVSQELPVANIVFPLAFYSPPPSFNSSVIYQSVALAGPPNKAPPRCFGNALLHWFQVYRC